MRRQAEIFEHWEPAKDGIPELEPTEKIKIYNLVYEVHKDVAEFMTNLQAAYHINYQEREKAVEYWQGEKDYNILKGIEKYAERKEEEFRETAIECFKSRHCDGMHGYDYYYRAFLDYKHAALAWNGVRRTLDLLKTENLNEQ